MSSETGFDWTNLSPEEQEYGSKRFDITIPPGKTCIIKEVVGVCGSNSISTQTFEEEYV